MPAQRLPSPAGVYNGPDALPSPFSFVAENDVKEHFVPLFDGSQLAVNAEGMASVVSICLPWPD